jgi:hypothetical protein
MEVRPYMAINEAAHGEVLGRVMPEEFGLTIDETIGGLALIALGIVSLVGIYPWLIDSINTVIAGTALLLMSVGLTGELARAYASPGRELMESEIGSGLSAGVMAGIAGITLGILAILGIARPTLFSVAEIVFGGAVLLDFALMAQIKTARANIRTGAGEPARVASGAAGIAMASIFTGVALVTLGIISVVGVRPDILVACALIVLGGYLFLKGTAVVAFVLSWALV